MLSRSFRRVKNYEPAYEKCECFEDVGLGQHTTWNGFPVLTQHKAQGGEFPLPAAGVFTYSSPLVQNSFEVIMFGGNKTVVAVWPPPGEGEAEKRACLVMIVGDQIGRPFYIDKAETLIGRGGEYDLSLEDPLVSRTHASIVKQDHDIIRIKDLGSTNGTLVNSQRVREAQLGDGDRITIGTSVFKFVHKDHLEAGFHDEIYRLASQDGLTGLYNRKCFEELCEKEIRGGVRRKIPMSLCIFDIDHFKEINDIHGHPAGDHILVEIAGRIRSRLSKGDVFGRYGGDEFCLFLPDTNAREAFEKAESIRKLIAGNGFSHEEAKINVTISMGIYTHSGNRYLTVDEFIEKADKKLYESKAGGRNRVAQ